MNLMQDQMWTTREGVTLRLEDMTPDHRRNTLCWLRRHAAGLKFHYELSIIMSPMQPSGDMACDAFDAGLRELEEEPDAQWLNTTPLVLRLTGLVAADQRWPR